jgi:hypothetical protein
MKSRKYIIIPFLLLFLGMTSGNETPVKENKYVKTEVSLSSDTVRAGTKVALLITLSPIDGIHINVDPAVEVTLENNKYATLDGQPEMNSDKETGFLDTTDPVEQQLSCNSAAEPGRYTLKGTIVYYFCSDAQGWCTKFAQPFSLRVSVTK